MNNLLLIRFSILILAISVTLLVSQTAFLRLLDRGLVLKLEAPTLWDVDFRTAVAQAELEDRERPGAYHRVRFLISEGSIFGNNRAIIPPVAIPGF